MLHLHLRTSYSDFFTFLRKNVSKTLAISQKVTTFAPDLRPKGLGKVPPRWTDASR